MIFSIINTIHQNTRYFAPGNNFGEQIKRSVSESIGLTLSLPILDGKRTKMAVARANAQRINAQLDTESRLNDIAQQIESCYIDLRAAQSRYTAGEEQVKSAELSNELVNEQFNLGLVNTIELLTAHNNLLEARHSLLQAKYMAILEHKMIEFYRTSSVTMP
ncbi:TolC family protein [Muribaculum sp.]|uniref:TolC family protein n=1 Tax=Muribaculum sp. TaxID=1918611 RepID=UPI002580EA61|nr:TolC family protein [Muribaculum sp.]